MFPSIILRLAVPVAGLLYLVFSVSISALIALSTSVLLGGGRGGRGADVVLILNAIYYTEIFSTGESANPSI
jgi:hypothetical protein